MQGILGVDQKNIFFITKKNKNYLFDTNEFEQFPHEFEQMRKAIFGM